MRDIVFTICARNYIPHAEALYHSFRAVHGDSVDFLLILTDGAGQGDIPALDARQMDIPQYASLAFKFSISELCTTVKPFAFAHLFAQGYDRVVYIDPDMYLYAPLDRTFIQLEQYALVLTPSLHHIDSSFRLEYEHYSVGVFNLGFAAMRRHESTERLLQWWQDRCAMYGFKQYKHYGVFFDQKFMDRAPIYMGGLLYIECHDGYNVGRWNLQERGLHVREDRYYTNDVPLVLYHFSGLGRLPLSHPSTMEIVASVTKAGGPAVAQLHEDYIRQVTADAYDARRGVPYAFAQYANGVPIPENHRAIYAAQHEAWAAGRQGQFNESAMTDPFRVGEGSFYQQLLNRNCFVLGI